MANNSWNQSMGVQPAAGTALTNSTTATSLLNAAQAKWTIPANQLVAGLSKIRIYASGKMSTAASSPGTFTFDVRFGSVIVFNGGASGTLATSATNLTWDLKIDLTCLTTGASTSATMLGTGVLTSAALSATTPIMLLPTSAPAAGTGFDSTSSQTVDLFGTWSVANASNSITCQQFEIVYSN